MGLDKNCIDKPYLIGRVTALVESLVNVPSDFVVMVQVNPLQKLAYHLREALKTEDEELMGICNMLGDIPSPFVDSKGQFYIGYYHQKSEISRNEERGKIGKRISQLRKEKGLSQRALSELCGVTYQNINKIELGRYSVGLDVLNKICDSLGCELRIEKAEG